ncbi:MAG: FecR domain-containing protein [Bacteroidota bacterium]
MMINLEKYKSYSTQELLEDQEFSEWLKAGATSSPEQVEFLSKYPRLATQIEEAKKIMAAIQAFTPIPKPSPDFEKKLQETMQTAKAERPALSWSRTRWSAAAAILLLITLGIAFWPSSTPQDTALVFETNYGEWKQFELPDGSIVELNAGSKLVWQGGRERIAHLSGEAFFTVTKKPETGANFKVITEDLEVEVLGTRFNVQTAAKTGTEVFLEEGSVTIHTEKEDVKMVPDQLFTYKKGNTQIEAPKASRAVDHSSWKDGVLNLQEQSVEKSFAKIEKIYGLKIVCEDETLLKSVKTIAIPIDDLATTKQILEQIFEVKMTQTKDSLIITPISK